MCACVLVVCSRLFLLRSNGLKIGYELAPCRYEVRAFAGGVYLTGEKVGEGIQKELNSKETHQPGGGKGRSYFEVTMEVPGMQVS